MKKLIEYVAQRAKEESESGKGFIMYNAFQNLCVYVDPLQQENTLLDVINFLYLKNKSLEESYLDHLKRCTHTQPMVDNS